MEKTFRSDDTTRTPRFQQYDSVVLKKNIKGTILKKGDSGAVMEIYKTGDVVAYEVDFVEKKTLESILEKDLKHYRAPKPPEPKPR